MPRKLILLVFKSSFRGIGIFYSFLPIILHDNANENQHILGIIKTLELSFCNNPFLVKIYLFDKNNIINLQYFIIF